MCGRFSRYATARMLCEVFGLDGCDDVRPSGNIAPTQDAIVLLDASPRHGSALRWGLIPGWAKDMKIGSKMINARAETLSVKPSFRNLVRSRRCIVIADGFYEWKQDGKMKIPYRIEYVHGLFGMAGLWDEWKSPSGGIMRTFTIITTSPNRTMLPIHDRMPIIIEPSQKDAWLRDCDLGLLRPVDDALIAAFPVREKFDDMNHE